MYLKHPDLFTHSPRSHTSMSKNVSAASLKLSQIVGLASPERAKDESRMKRIALITVPVSFTQTLSIRRSARATLLKYSALCLSCVSQAGVTASSTSCFISCHSRAAAFFTVALALGMAQVGNDVRHGATPQSSSQSDFRTHHRRATLRAVTTNVACNRYLLVSMSRLRHVRKI